MIQVLEEVLKEWLDAESRTIKYICFVNIEVLLSEITEIFAQKYIKYIIEIIFS